MDAADQQAIRQARFINRRWITRNGLADTAERYLDQLATRNPATLSAVCRKAVAAARTASKEHRDPKPDFYASIFSRATRAERDTYLRNHFFTRLLSAEMQDRET